MENLIPIIIWAAVIFLIIVRMKTGNKKAKKKTTTIESIVREAAVKGAGAATPKKAAEMAVKQLLDPAQAEPAAAHRKGTLFAAGIHDDKNDWLSQQLAEEKRSERLMSAMFGLKLEHALDCPAEKIRDEHAANCDAEKVRRYSRH